jgi:epoxyqueuosine reductase
VQAKAALVADCRREGFDAIGVAAPDAALPAGERLMQFLADGHHGTMTWLADTAERRADVRALWPEANAVVIVGMNYGPDRNPLAALGDKSSGAISVYAGNRDYHELIKGKLKVLAGRFKARTGSEVKVFVDTAPLMEKPFAAAAGLGWQGKHTNLVSRDFGSWLFLGAIVTTMPLPADAAVEDSCGTCTACLDVCPTKAFPAPYRLDARRCISYLTIEHDGPIPREFRAAIGNRIYGCDDCLAVCPWNKFARRTAEIKLAMRDDLRAPPLAELAKLDDSGFRKRFSASAIKRIGRDRFLRNVMIAIGNSRNDGLVPTVERAIEDGSAIVRGAAVWALSRLSPSRFAELVATRPRDETDAGVRKEWEQ